jgi:hypothetical protein
VQDYIEKYEAIYAFQDGDWVLKNLRHYLAPLKEWFQEDNEEIRGLFR